MNNKIKFNVCVDLINLADASVYSGLLEKADAYNQKTRNRTGLDYIEFDIEFGHKPTCNEIWNQVNSVSESILGIKPYDEIEGECATACVSTKTDDGQDVVLSHSESDALEMSNIDLGYDYVLVHRAYPDPDSSEYVDYRLGKKIN